MEKMAAGARQQMHYWYYYHDGTQFGPVAEAELKALLASGKLPLDIYVWREGLAGWVTAEQAALGPGRGGAASAPEQEQSAKSPAGPGKEAEMPAWYYHLNGQTWGPVREEELIDLLKSGQINPGTYLWREGLDGWITVASAGLAGNAAGGEVRKSGNVCPACAKPVKRGARFCPACGSKLPEECAGGAARL